MIIKDGRHKYISQNKRGDYLLIIWHNSKRNYLGIFNNVDDAVIVRDKFLSENKLTRVSKTYENHYVDNKDMLIEMIISKAQGKLTHKLLLMFMSIVKGVSKKFRYKDPEDRFDCECYCYEIIIKNWMMFDLDVYDNVFAWGTQVVKNGFAMQFKILQKTRLNTISLDYKNSEGNSIQNYI